MWFHISCIFDNKKKSSLLPYYSIRILIKILCNNTWREYNTRNWQKSHCFRRRGYVTQVYLDYCMARTTKVCMINWQKHLVLLNQDNLIIFSNVKHHSQNLNAYPIYLTSVDRSMSSKHPAIFCEIFFRK